MKWTLRKLREGLPEPYEFRHGDIFMPLPGAASSMAPLYSVCILNHCDVCQVSWALVEWKARSAPDEQYSVCQKCLALMEKDA